MNGSRQKLVLVVSFIFSLVCGTKAQIGDFALSIESTNIGEVWQQRVGGCLTNRGFHTAVWTGKEMIIWGGTAGGSGMPDGRRYNPKLDAWFSVPINGAPVWRDRHTAVWTGTEMIVWGGFTDGFSSARLGTGSRYDPDRNVWTPISSTNAPIPRFLHSAVWTGTEMIIWGGQATNFTATGGRYNPSTDTWIPIATNGAPAGRQEHSAVWTGTEMIVWGGDGTSYFNTGARYNPATDTWTPVTTNGAPSARALHTAVWTGSEMIVWGGVPGSGSTPFANGARYNPVTDTWSAVNTNNAPLRRYYHTAVWTGDHMVIAGGLGGAVGYSYSDGAQYDPISDAWTATDMPISPRHVHTAIWTGTEMIVWGGNDIDSNFSNRGYRNDGARFNPQSNVWTKLSNGGLGSRQESVSVWTGTEMIVWGGNSSPFATSGFFTDGARYNPMLNRWQAISAPVNFAGRRQSTGVWSGSEMLIWGGYNGSAYFGDGARYNPTSNSWQTISTNSCPSPRSQHTAVWNGKEMIVWGGSGNNGGGRYDPLTDQWKTMAVPNSFSGRNGHSAVSTGTEMIVWGGYGSFYLGDGSRYSYANNTWNNISTNSAPSARTMHSAVWTGSEMIVWGGYGYGPVELNTGARYNPTTDTWLSVSTNGAPSARHQHSAIWTGTEMIIWGGLGSTLPSYPNPNDAALYNPVTDTWRSLVSGPNGSAEGRGTASIVWTGSSMLIFGGFYQLTYDNYSFYNVFLNDTWIYCPGGAPATRLTWSSPTDILRLECVSDLSFSNWSTVQCLPRQTDGDWQATVFPIGSNAFFRLHGP